MQGAFHAKSFFNVVVAATMASLFVVIFWVAQVGAAATAAAAVKTETYAVSSNAYLPIQLLEFAY